MPVDRDKALIINDESKDQRKIIGAGEEAVDGDGRIVSVLVRMTVDPTASDYSHPIGTTWLNLTAKTAFRLFAKPTLTTADWRPTNATTLVFGSQIVYATAGTFTFTVPDFVTAVTVDLWGGGGGAGGGLNASNNAGNGAGGGGGGRCRKRITGLTPGATITVTVGAAGTGGAANTNGTAGGTTSFGAYASATGGGGGLSGNTGGITTDTAGGTGVGGDLNVAGQTGLRGTTSQGTPCAWGGSASAGGTGGMGGITNGQAGLAGTQPGGGGGGGGGKSGGGAGGNGSPGLAMVSW